MMNNIKKTNVFALLMVGLFMGMSVIISYVPILQKVNSTLVLDGGMILMALLFCLFMRKNPIEFLRFRKINFKTWLYIGILSLVGLPFVSLINYISMIFSKNIIMGQVDTIIGDYLGTALLWLAVLPAFTEELVYRGAVLSGYKEEDDSFKKIVMSALLFAALHMNFNQISYAFVLGVLMAILVELTDSIWSSMWLHFCINGTSVYSTWVAKRAGGDVLKNSEAEMAELMADPIQSLLLLIPAGVLSLILILLMIYLIARQNGTTHVIGDWFFGKQQEWTFREDGSVIKKKVKYADVFYLVTIGFCVLMAVAVEIT